MRLDRFHNQNIDSPPPPPLLQVLCGGASEGSTFPLELPGTTSVSELRTMLHQLVGITPCNQVTLLPLLSFTITHSSYSF